MQKTLTASTLIFMLCTMGLAGLSACDQNGLEGEVTDEEGLVEEEEGVLEDEEGVLEDEEDETGVLDEENDVFGDWDADDDDQVVQQEFVRGIEELGYFSSWDNDNDGSLTAEEFASGVFSAWAVDQEVLTEEVYEDRAEAWFDEEEALGEFEEVDADDDGAITQAEFVENTTTEEMLEEWDLDDSDFIEESEFGESWFNLWDEDDSGYIVEEEFGF